MKAVRWALGIAAAAVVLVLAAWMAGDIALPFAADDGNRPPCAQLASPAEVARALSAQHRFVEQIEAVGPGVTVVVGQPCPDKRRALVSIRVRSGKEHDAVDRLLRDGDGFGVPAEIVEE